jgi:hypothetical protein
MVEKASEIVGKIYQNYFLRDLTYIFGGALILTSIYYCFYNKAFSPIELIYAVTSSTSIFLIMVTSCYFIGYVFKDLIYYLFKVIMKNQTYHFNDHLVFFEHLRFYNGDRNLLLQLYNRTIFLEHVCISLGSSSIISAVLLLCGKYVFNRSDIPLWVIMFLFILFIMGFTLFYIKINDVKRIIDSIIHKK